MGSQPPLPPRETVRRGERGCTGTEFCADTLPGEVFIEYRNRPLFQGWGDMLSLISLCCLASGVALALLSLRRPGQAVRLSRWSGVCLVAGLGLLGAALRGAR